MMGKLVLWSVYVLIWNVHADYKIKNVLVKVLKSNCKINGNTDCSNRYLQICYHNFMYNVCFGKMSIDCLLRPSDLDPKKTDLKAVNGSSVTFAYTEQITSIRNVIIGISKTTTTSSFPIAMSCELERNQTSNGFRIYTQSYDGKYEFDLLIEVVCTNSNCSGQTCDNCGDAYPSTTKKISTITTNVRDRNSSIINHKGKSTNIKTSISTFSTRAVRVSTTKQDNVNSPNMNTVADILIGTTCILFLTTVMLILGILIIFFRKPNKTVTDKGKLNSFNQLTYSMNRVGSYIQKDRGTPTPEPENHDNSAQAVYQPTIEKWITDINAMEKCITKTVKKLKQVHEDLNKIPQEMPTKNVQNLQKSLKKTLKEIEQKKTILPHVLVEMTHVK